MKVNHKLAKISFHIGGKKRVTFNRAPIGCFFKIYRYWYMHLSFEVEFYFVSEHLPDDSGQACRAQCPKCIVVRPAFSPLWHHNKALKVALFLTTFQAAFTRAYQIREPRWTSLLSSLKVTRLINEDPNQSKNNSLLDWKR